MGVAPGTVEDCRRDVTLVTRRPLCGRGCPAEQMNSIDDLRLTYGIDVHTYHDWDAVRADELPCATTVSPKLVCIRFAWPYIGWPIGSDAKRPDSIDVIAGPKFEAS